MCRLEQAPCITSLLLLLTRLCIQGEAMSCPFCGGNHSVYVVEQLLFAVLPVQSKALSVHNSLLPLFDGTEVLLVQDTD